MPSRSTKISEPDTQPKILLPLPGDESDGHQDSGAEETKHKNLKRKLPGDDNTKGNKESRRQKKARKAAESKTTTSAKPGKAEKRKQQVELINEDLGHMNGQLLADYFARQVRRFERELSEVEMEDRRIAAGAFKDTSDFDQERKLASLPTFLQRYSGRSHEQLCQAASRNGAPHTLVVAASGIRAADVTRALRVFQTKEALVAKLFAKHIKLKEALDMARNSRMHIGVGTPQRILDLIDQGAVTSEGLERIIVDASALNQKRRGILDMAETERPLSRLLARRELKGVELLVF